MSCRQACPYNTLNGCKVKEYNAICPLGNMASTQASKPKTNADRIRAMSDEELADMVVCPHVKTNWDNCKNDCFACRLEWLQQSAEGE